MNQQAGLFELPTHTRVEQRRDASIEQGMTTAQKEMANWRRLAMTALRDFLAQRGEHPFLTEAFRMFARGHGVPDPPDARTWGGVMTAAKKEKLIESVGFDRALTSNLSPKVLWKRK